MTVPSSTSSVSYTADGISALYSVPFRFLQNSHILVTTRQGTGAEVIEVGTYTVAGAGSPSGGTVTFSPVKAAGTIIVISRNVPLTQEADYVDNDPFPAESHEDALDKLTMISQQLKEQGDRSLRLPITAVGVSTQLPAPLASNLIGWNSTANGLRNFTTAEIATSVAFTNWRYDSFTATVGQTAFVLAADPGAIGNLDVSIDGVTQVPIDDYTLSGTTLTMTSALVGGERVLARYGTAAGATDASSMTWQPAGTGAVQRTVQGKLRESVSALDFGAVGDGVANDTAALSAALAYCRSVAKPLYMPAGTYRTTAVLDISGVTIIGDAKGYRNANGTIIEGSGTHDVLAQINATADLTRVDLHNLRIRGGLWGVKVRYMLHSHWSNVHVTNCSQGGIQFGNSSDAGGLFNTFDNIETDVTGTGIDINGNQFVNANSFNQCFFKGTQYGGRLRCNGGIGAVSNMFNCTEFLGDRFGIEMENTSNTGFNECYFESKGPSAHFVGSRNIGWAFDDCTFAVLENSNPTGKNAFIYHVAGGIARGSIKGGWVYLANLAVHANLSFVASEAPGSFFLFMADQPEFDVTATGFVVLNGLTSQNLNINDAGSYSVSWASSGTQPAIGNGTLSGRYSRIGNSVTVSITLTGGSTTTWGTGTYTFSLPYPAQVQAAGSCYILDAGTGYFAPVALVGPGSSAVAAYLPGGANIVGATQPMTWATNDQITITLTYEC